MYMCKDTEGRDREPVSLTVYLQTWLTVLEKQASIGNSEYRQNKQRVTVLFLVSLGFFWPQQE